MRPMNAGSIDTSLFHRLARGHYYTSIDIEQLPCSSKGDTLVPGPSTTQGARAQAASAAAPRSGSTATTSSAPLPGGQQQGKDGGGKEFLVLSSYIVYDGKVHPGLEKGMQLTQVWESVNAAGITSILSTETSS